MTFDDLPDIPDDAYDDATTDEERKETIKTLLSNQDEIELQEIEYDIKINPTWLEILEISNVIAFGGFDFVAKINENETIKMRFTCWYQAATLEEPEDSGYEITPIKET